MSALEDLRIVDFSRFLPGAYASWIAADLGADVIRIEHPRELAKHKAMFGSDEDPNAATRRRARPTYTRNKRSLLINPGHDQARAVLHRLIAEADILIEDYRPGVLAKMGYGYAEMAELNPRLIYCSVSFAGQTGPYASRPGHDPAALALAGALSRLNGLPTPTLPGLQVADVLAGCHATIAMLAALQAREKSGRGQHADIAMSDASMPLLMVTMGRHDDLDALPPPGGAWHPKGGVWECADGGWLCTTDMEPAYWARFCAAIGRPDLVALQHDVAQHPAVEAELKALFRTRSRDDWFALLSAAGTQAMPVLSIAEALADPHNRAREMVRDVPVAGDDRPVVQLGLPFHLSASPPRAPIAAGMPGAESAAILEALGFDEAARFALEDSGAFASEQGAGR
ncbi:CaiB/BaiF CoA-transferase family protein [Sphingosinicella sp. BN140058]|uniref:CaiB/BaiF CoA transferase family protein n=1 Tax=Sphingosinicella sp. BN140058 TaxID=1892855 RepID=UPI0013ED1E1F|nr:CaiB/BaiF CoA-transferase family protein [Sphingosinicella sp. BN140058]